ncbi:MAG: Holliday junction DNA helicase RuvA [Cellvibrionaceae bacterium]|jgi:Holliday junction DNA helicase RuvA
MIASVNGPILKRGKDHIVINVGSMGIRVNTPKTVLENLGGIGREILLYTHLIVRETELSLYGFLQEDELELFGILLAVNGVGPKVALAIISTLSPDMLKSAILREEPAALQRVPGIGKKTAQKIMFELQNKLDMTTEPTVGSSLVTDTDAEVIDFLTSLGFSIIESQGALQKVPRDIETIEEKVQTALQYLGQE